MVPNILILRQFTAILYFCSFHDSLIFVQGSKAQLEQVWEETDGLEAKDFDPRTFFKLHGEYYCIFVFNFNVA